MKTRIDSQQEMNLNHPPSQHSPRSAARGLSCLRPPRLPLGGRGSLLTIVAGFVSLLLALAPAGAVEYSTATWVGPSPGFQMWLEIDLNPISKAVVITAGFMQINHSGTGYRVEQAKGALVPVLGTDEMAGVVVFGVGSSAFATMFMGELAGGLGAAGSTLTAKHVTFEYRNIVYTIPEFVMTPAFPTAPTLPAKPAPPQPPPPYVGPTVPIVVSTLFDDYNTAGVGNLPRFSPVFHLSSETYVTEIRDYHWNGGTGYVPGQISLVCGSQKFGPWQVEGSPLSRVINWIVQPNIVLPPGSYTIEDSSPATWSWNPQSGGAGFSTVSGEVLPAETLWWDTSNIDGVNNGPQWYPKFTITAPMFVSQIWTYHFNGGQGALPGQIGLLNSAGQMVGLWQVEGSPGVRTENWLVRANAALPAGTYEIYDSQDSTWSWNSQSQGLGFVKMWVQ